MEYVLTAGVTLWGTSDARNFRRTEANTHATWT